MSNVSRYGWTGVDLFFVLSGYLIASELFETTRQDKNISLPVFFIKRIMRIMPPFLLLVAVYFLFPVSRERDSIAPLWKYLTFTQNLGLDIRSQGTFSHAWSLCIEEQFYLILPLAVYFLFRFRAMRMGKYLLAALFLTGFFIRWACFHYLVAPFAGTDDFWAQWYKWEYYPTFTRLDGLLTGVSIAAIFRYVPKWRAVIERRGNLMLAIACAIFLLCYLVFDEHSFNATLFGFPLVDIGYGFLVMAAISPPCIIFNWGPKPVVRIATYSYVIYLTHKMIIHAAQPALEQFGLARDGALMFVLCTALCVIAAFIINILVEKPALKLRNRLLARYQKPAGNTRIRRSLVVQDS